MREDGQLNYTRTRIRNNRTQKSVNVAYDNEIEEMVTTALNNYPAGPSIYVRVLSFLNVGELNK